MGSGYACGLFMLSVSLVGCLRVSLMSWLVIFVVSIGWKCRLGVGIMGSFVIFLVIVSMRLWNCVVCSVVYGSLDVVMIRLVFALVL